MAAVHARLLTPRRPGPALIALAAVLLAACNSGPVASVAPPSAQPTTTVGAASRAPASAVPKPQDAAIAAFVEKVAAGDLAYHVAFKGRTALTVNELPTTGTLDVDGHDFALSYTYDLDHDYPGTGEVRIQIRAVDDKAWAKLESGKWTALKGWRDTETSVPFHAVETVRDVKYLVTEQRKGKDVYRVHIPEVNLIDPTTIPGALTDEKVQRTDLELLIDDQGTPLAGTWQLKGQGRVGGGQLQAILYQLDLTFSKVGGKVSISKP